MPFSERSPNSTNLSSKPHSGGNVPIKLLFLKRILLIFVLPSVQHAELSPCPQVEQGSKGSTALFGLFKLVQPEPPSALYPAIHAAQSTASKFKLIPVH